MADRGSGTVTWKGSVLLQRPSFFVLNDFVADVMDRATDLLGFRVALQLVSVDPADSSTPGKGKESPQAYLRGWVTGPVRFAADKGTEYRVSFKVPKDFGIPGAVLVENHHRNRFWLQQIRLERSDNAAETITFHCNSWVYNPALSGGPRIFFRNKSYLPSQTPQGLKALRELELRNLRGDGTGLRKVSDRVYDYDVYNDLGNPDKAREHARTTLGGNQDFPYPRRCRTGRPQTKADPDAESPVNIFHSLYVPADEQFPLVKQNNFFGSAIRAFIHTFLPLIKQFLRSNFNYKSFPDVLSLYSSSILADLRKRAESLRAQRQNRHGIWNRMLFRGLTTPQGVIDDGGTPLLKFPVPEIIQVTNEAWREDSEFARQLLVGVNPIVITKLKVFPPPSKLDSSIYGSTTSRITKEDLEVNMGGVTVEEALEKNLLYIVDYHDALLPYVERVNKLKGKMYATRTVLFLKSDGTLKPVAIELSLPQSSDGQVPATKRVFTPPLHSARDHLWELAKLHAVANDSGYHELISHWLRTHATIEPIIIATRRQLSAMHPIYSLLVPHFKNTMRINALARNNLINSFSGSLVDGGIIEFSFTLGKYAMELSSKAYKESWRLDQESLPADLIKRGMAERDAGARHGLKLHIADYPYAVDGLDIWAAIDGWAREYVGIFYERDADVEGDAELQAWWSEARYSGHADKAAEDWWPAMRARSELAGVLATVMWLASAHHAAVNFGQFGYGGFPPSRPSMTRLLVPARGSRELQLLLDDPDAFFFRAMPPGPPSLVVIATLEILSQHSPDEEYIGDATPAVDDVSHLAVREALVRFRSRLAGVGLAIRRRNADRSLRNRHGSSGIDYAILFPRSEHPGLTGRGIPNSVSI